MMEITNEQNHQRMHLEQWAQDLREREMHVVERELKLLMANKSPRERTPKIQKRSGNFMRQLFSATLNGSSSLSSTTATQVISHPTSSFFFFNKKQNNHSYSIRFSTFDISQSRKQYASATSSSVIR